MTDSYQIQKLLVYRRNNAPVLDL